jgi:hypothetical protein
MTHPIFQIKIKGEKFVTGFLYTYVDRLSKTKVFHTLNRFCYQYGVGIIATYICIVSLGKKER